MDRMSDTIADRLKAQRKRLADAARGAGRDPDEIILIAVSKKQSVEALREAYAAGQRDFGENYVQELLGKAQELAAFSDIRWHMIGHLQSNKARLIAGLVHRVHSVSSVKLALELGLRAERASLDGSLLSHSPLSHSPLRVLIEVNLSGEASKSGCAPEDVPKILEAAQGQQFLQVTGLMTMPPASEDAREARPYFDRLHELRESCGGAAQLPELSMGMSHDAEEAVAAGATYVRIGSAIFGSRST